MFTAFGTQGSQVRILPLRPFILAIHFSGLFLIAGGSRVNRRFRPETQHRSAFPRRMASEACPRHPLSEEGAGNAECTLHPRSRVHDVVRCAHEHTGTVGTLRHSLRNGLTAYAVLSLETNSFCLHPCRLDGSTDPVGSNAPPAA